MIIWANRMYPIYRQFVLSVRTTPSVNVMRSAANHAAGAALDLPVQLVNTVTERTAERYVRELPAVAAGTRVSASSAVQNLSVLGGNNTYHTEEDRRVSRHAVYGGNTVQNQSLTEVQNRTVNTDLSRTHNLTRNNTRGGDQTRSETVHYHTNVQVEMTNYNQVHGEQDMVRLAERLSDALYAALESGGEGVGARCTQ